MNLLIRLEEEKDYYRVEEITKKHFHIRRDLNAERLVVHMSIGWLMNYEREMEYFL